MLVPENVGVYAADLSQCAVYLARLDFSHSSSFCSPPYTNCRRKVLLNVTGEPFITLAVDGWTKKSVATLRNPHGSETSITSGYSTQYMDVEFLGDRNIFIHVDLNVRVHDLLLRI